eukprot:gene35075-47129_t
MTDYAPDPALLAKAETLVEALPYMQRYAGATFVVKYGGHAMGDPEAARDFAEDVDALLHRMGRIDPLDLLRAPKWLPRLTRLGGYGVLKKFRALVRRTMDARRALMKADRAK